MSQAMTVNLAIELVLALIARSQEISLLIQQARAEGRETFSPEEWARIVSADDAARARLVAAIAKAGTPPT